MQKNLSITVDGFHKTCLLKKRLIVLFHFVMHINCCWCILTAVTLISSDKCFKTQKKNIIVCAETKPKAHKKILKLTSLPVYLIAPGYQSCILESISALTRDVILSELIECSKVFMVKFQDTQVTFPIGSKYSIIKGNSDKRLSLTSVILKHLTSINFMHI